TPGPRQIRQSRAQIGARPSPVKRSIARHEEDRKGQAQKSRSKDDEVVLPGAHAFAAPSILGMSVLPAGTAISSSAKPALIAAGLSSPVVADGSACCAVISTAFVSSTTIAIRIPNRHLSALPSSETVLRGRYLALSVEISVIELYCFHSSD